MDGIHPSDRWADATVQQEELEGKTTSAEERERAGGSDHRMYKKKKEEAEGDAKGERMDR